jgi:hypothetical protein
MHRPSTITILKLKYKVRSVDQLMLMLKYKVRSVFPLSFKLKGRLNKTDRMIVTSSVQRPASRALKTTTTSELELEKE